MTPELADAIKGLAKAMKSTGWAVNSASVITKEKSEEKITSKLVSVPLKSLQEGNGFKALRQLTANKEPPYSVLIKFQRGKEDLDILLDDAGKFSQVSYTFVDGGSGDTYNVCLTMIGKVCHWKAIGPAPGKPLSSVKAMANFIQEVE